MSNEAVKFLTTCRRAIACLWALVGSWLVFATLRHFGSRDISAAIGLSVGLVFAIAGGGLFFNKRWGRISIGCLMVLVVLWAADTLLFIAFRGLYGRESLLGLIIALALASISTWSLLAATRPRAA
jgi:hypothetical protein